MRRGHRNTPRQDLKHCPRCRRSCCPCHRKFPAHSADCARNNPVRSRLPRCRTFGRQRRRRFEWAPAEYFRAAHCPRCHRNYCRDHRRFQFRGRRQRRCIAALRYPAGIPKLLRSGKLQRLQNMPRQALKHCPQCHRSCCPCHRKFPAHSADCARNNPVRSRFPRCRTFGRHRRRRPACRLAGQSLAAGCPPLHRSCCRDHRRTYRLARSVEWQNNQVPSNRQRGRKPSKLPRIRRPACRLAGLVRLAHCPRCHRNYCRDHRRFQFRVRRQRRCIAAHHAPVDIPKLPVFHIPLYPQSRTRQALKCCPPLHRSCCRDHRRFLPSDFRPEHHTQVYQIKYCRP